MRRIVVRGGESSELPLIRGLTLPFFVSAARKTNRLARETSPYLLQHAHNPVDWHPWGDEAIDAARRTNRLIFLSIGYSTCYWCHVMERESFENEAIAGQMNEQFVCIKVDREERPDLDDIYMTAVQALTGRGGWPMSVWLDPDTLAPVYGGTYFPAQSMHGMRSFPEIMHLLHDAWDRQRSEMRQAASRIAEAVREELARPSRSVAVGMNEVGRAVNQLVQSFDREHGGFGGSPKFPQPVFLELLLAAREWMDARSAPQLDAVIRATLDGMAMGGLFDQVGGGFHRYSTDAKWLVPHFEKMLYDNGQLASIYARASSIYRDPFYARVARRTLDYVLREMRVGDSGGFASAQDAEVDAREGLNYLWTREEVERVLREAGLEGVVDFAVDVYGLGDGPNFRDPHHPGEPPSNVLHLVAPPLELAAKWGVSLEEFFAHLDRVNDALRVVRDRRRQPGRDDKIIVSWNGLMIGALATGGDVLGDPRYIAAAGKAAKFILDRMRTPEGGLLRTWRGGQARIDAFLGDYALLARGLIDLHRATSDGEWLRHAVQIMGHARDRFWDREHGGFFDTLADRPDLFVRTRTMHDGAIPCGNAVMLHNLLDLAAIMRDEPWLDQAQHLLAAMSGAIQRAPVGAVLATAGLLRMAVKWPERLPRDAPGSHRVEASGGVVTITVDRDEVRVSGDSPGVLTTTITIAPGHHINAHEPGDSSLQGLVFSVVGAEGLVLHAEYPVGEPWRDGVMVHHGSVAAPVVIEQVGPVRGTPRVEVSFQACTEDACLAPSKVTLPVRVVV